MTELTINSTEDLHLLSERLNFHIFRGQQKDWSLKPRLLRVLEAFQIERGNYRNRENNMLREFQSRIALYTGSVAKPNDLVSEYSLMQHYGAPTRLLDFTKSLYLAAFFAVEDVEQEDDSFIWCINEKKVRDKIAPPQECTATDGNTREVQYKEMRRLAEGELTTDSNDKDGLLIIEPKERNERMSRQQGVFLFSLSVEKPIEEVLEKEFDCKKEKDEVDVSGYDEGDFYKLKAAKIRISNNCKKYILQSLNQMNVNHETLFPGIEGFCRSLYFKLSLL